MSGIGGMGGQLVDALQWGYVAFATVCVFGGLLLLAYWLTALVNRAIGRFLDLAAFVEVAAEMQRQGRAVWLQRRTRWHDPHG